MSKKQLTTESLAAYVKEQAKKMMESQDFSSHGDPTDVKMNKMVKGADAKPTATTKNVGGKQETKSAKVAASDATKVDMNQMDKEQGSDGKVATAVKVKASGKMNSEQSSNVGMNNPDFESKKQNPPKSTGEPFDKDGELEMNSMDKEIDEGTKTYVEASGEMSSSQATNVGMKKPKVHEDAPGQPAPEAIAKAIEMPKEGYVFKDKNELLEWTRSQAKKVADLL